MYRSLEEGLGYIFEDRKLLENALTHSSYANENRARGYTSNERLEFLGDSVLGMVTATRLYALYPDMPEGKMSACVPSSSASRRCTAWRSRCIWATISASATGRSAAADASARPSSPMR